MRMEAIPVTRRSPRTHGRYLPHILGLLVVALLLGGLTTAYLYVGRTLADMNATVTSAGVNYTQEAEHWWNGDADHLDALAKEWPASIPTLLSEIGLLWLEQQQMLQNTALSFAQGYEVIPPEAAGRLHLLSVAIENRTDALLGQWDRSAGHASLVHFRGYPIDFGAAALPVQADEVAGILDAQGLPHSVFSGYRITLLPFALKGTSMPKDCPIQCFPVIESPFCRLL